MIKLDRRPVRRQPTETRRALIEDPARVVYELHKRIVIAEPPLEPGMRPDSLIRDHDAAVCVAALAENVGGSLSSRTGERVEQPDIGLEPHPDREAAQDAVWAHFRGPISSTVPTTARGCAEPARYVGEFREFQGVDLGDELAAILANIVRPC